MHANYRPEVVCKATIDVGILWRAPSKEGTCGITRRLPSLPTYNEHLSIAECITRFEALGIVDHVIVVNNNAHPDTSPAVAATGAIEVFEAEQGYGAAIQRGLNEALALGVDLISICEPDGTFDPEDLLKLLPYTNDVEVAPEPFRVHSLGSQHGHILNGAIGRQRNC